MAFNFNWTPLIASTSSSDFHKHARDLLTLALNKSASSSVIVDSNITVDDLNLGHSSPELEVLEIGDIAEDRFRGVFRMTYDGNAFVTLKTRVQINPLNTYLKTSEAYTSPNPLSAASMPLTIPVQLTLSNFKLSGFVMLVFSKEKGITLVFRNDPLESVQVRSSFDSIPFIKDYLQREIERQVRNLFQEELPLAVYKLSLRLLESESTKEEQERVRPPPAKEKAQGQENFDLYILPENSDALPSFPVRNMLRLRALMNFQKTLSLFTPAIKGAISRATPPSTNWGQPNIPSTGMSRGEYAAFRSGLPSYSSTMAPRNDGHIHLGRRKKKHRVVNLRKGRESTTSLGTSSASSEASSQGYGDAATTASAPEYGHDGAACGGWPRKFSPVDQNSLLGTNISSHLLSSHPEGPSILLRRDNRPILQSPFMETIARSLPLQSARPISIVAVEDRPHLNRGSKHPGSIVEKAFMIRFMAEMQRQAEESREELGESSPRGFV